MRLAATMSGDPGHDERGPQPVTPRRRWRTRRDAPAGARTEVVRETPSGRIVRTVVLACVYLVLEVGAKALAVAQLAWILWRRSPNPWIARRGGETASYFFAMWAYLTCASHEAPWPFAPWPRHAEGSESANAGRGPSQHAVSRRAM